MFPLKYGKAIGNVGICTLLLNVSEGKDVEIRVIVGSEAEIHG